MWSPYFRANFFFFLIFSLLTLGVSVIDKNLEKKNLKNFD